MIRYRFSDFILSPQRRLLLREGREVPLIPRYFDLLLLLIERRREAVHRREIFDRVWGEVMVSDSALSQAVRTIRRTLEDDDPREPRFIRTVSRHGYQFVFPDVIEEQEEEGAVAPAVTSQIAMPAVVSEETEGEQSGWQRVVRMAGRKAGAAAAGGATAGIAAGVAGGLILAFAPGSAAPLALVPVLAAIGGGCGGIGGAGVGAGLGAAEAFGRSRLGVLVVSAALGGGLVGAAVQWLSRWALAALVGLELPIGGALEGLLIGAAAGLALALGGAVDPDPEGFATARKRTVILAALCCGLAGLLLTLSGRPLAGGTIHAIADSADGSRATLAQLGRLIGEPDFGPVSSAILACGEGAVFGIGLALGIVRRRADSR